MKSVKSYILCIGHTKITKKLQSYKIVDIKLNSENSKTSEPYRLLLRLSDKINLKRSGKYLSIVYRWKKYKKVFLKKI